MFREWQGMNPFDDNEEILKALKQKEVPEDSEEVIAPLKTKAQKFQDAESYFVRDDGDQVDYSVEDVRAEGYVPLDVMGQEVFVGDYVRLYRDDLPPHRRDSSCYYKVLELIPNERKVPGEMVKNKQRSSNCEGPRADLVRGGTYFEWELMTDKGRMPFDAGSWLKVTPEEVQNAAKATVEPPEEASSDQQELT